LLIDTPVLTGEQEVRRSGDQEVKRLVGSNVAESHPCYLLISWSPELL
jgi:hypothetical protein